MSYIAKAFVKIESRDKRLYIDIKDDIHIDIALQVLHIFISKNMQGITIFGTPNGEEIGVTKKDYRKNGCYVIWKHKTNNYEKI